MPVADKAKGKKAAGAPAPVADVPAIVAPVPVSDQVPVERLLTPDQEYPKWVKGYIFKSRAEQDAAGPDYADEAE